MSTFFVFAGSDYYPCGGWEDFKGSRSTYAEALELVANTSCDWWHIVEKRPDSDATMVTSGKR